MLGKTILISLMLTILSGVVLKKNKWDKSTRGIKLTLGSIYLVGGIVTIIGTIIYICLW